MVMLVATTALLSIVDADRKAQNEQISFANLDFAIESISRAARVGSAFRCITGGFSNVNIEQPNDCSGGGTAFAFEPYGGSPGNPNDQYVYRLSGTQIQRSVDGGVNFVPITAPQIVIQGLTFYVRGANEAAKNKQPIVLMSVYGYAGTTTRSQVNFNIETSISQRLLDI